MPSYTFHSLSDADFEELCRDLLQAQLRLRLQSFTKGRDEGIDLLNALHNGDTIVQCKHYRGSSFSKLNLNRLVHIKHRAMLSQAVLMHPRQKHQLGPPPPHDQEQTEATH